MTEINVDGTVNILEAAVGTGTDRMIIASSSSVYGKPQYPHMMKSIPRSQLARMYYELHGLSTVCLRYFTVYGPRMRSNMAISNFVSRSLNGKPPVIYPSGEQTRDFTYVDDVVEANAALATSDIAAGEVLNIGSTDNISIQELTEVVRGQLAPKLELSL